MTMRWSVAGCEPYLEDSFYCPEFGRREAAKCLVIPLRQSAPTREELVW